MVDSFRLLGIAAAFGTMIIAAGLSGCSSISSDHVDCNVVKLQAESGRSDSEIASAIGADVGDVAKCHGAEKSGNKTSGDAVPNAPY
jgi:hypothetical protein